MHFLSKYSSLNDILQHATNYNSTTQSVLHQSKKPKCSNQSLAISSKYTSQRSDKHASLDQCVSNPSASSCTDKKCLKNKLLLSHYLQANKQLANKKNKYQRLYSQQQSKYAQKIESIQQIIAELNKRDQSLQDREHKMKELIEVISEEENRIITKKNQLALDSQLLENRKSQIEFEKNEFSQWQQGKWKEKYQLENRIKLLKDKEGKLVSRIEQLTQQESNLLAKISQMDLYYQNQTKHQQNLQEIEERFKTQCHELDYLASSISVKQDEQKQQDQQMHLRTLCNSMNEELFQKRINTEACIYKKQQHAFSKFCMTDQCQIQTQKVLDSSSQKEQKENIFKLYKKQILTER